MRSYYAIGFINSEGIPSGRGVLLLVAEEEEGVVGGY